MNMKNVFLLNLLLSFIFIGCSQDDSDILDGNCDYVDFRYLHDEQFFIGEMSNDYLVVGFDTIFSDEDIQFFISGLKKFDQSYDYPSTRRTNRKYSEVLLKLKRSQSCRKITRIISDLEENDIVAYAHFTSPAEDCLSWFTGQPIGSLCVNSYSCRVNTKLLSEDNFLELNRLMNETNTTLVERDSLICRFRVTKSSTADALAMANFFFETGLFEWAEPEISRIVAEE